MPAKLKHKTLLMMPTAVITAATTALAVYAGTRINAIAPGSFMAEAVPVGMSTVQQVLVMAWSEFSGHFKETASTSHAEKGNCHANA
jgi:hypothetical protein